MAEASTHTSLNAALIAFVRDATGLAQNRVMLSRPHTPSAQRPQRPFCAIGLRDAGSPVGQDWARQHPSDPAKQTYSGTRTIRADFDFYADTAAEAADLAGTLLSGTKVTPLRMSLFEAGLSIWAREGVTDLSALVNTAYEGRAQLTLQFAYTSVVTYDIDTMKQVSVTGTASGQGASETVTLTANLQKGSR